jgi:glutaredoxin
MFIRVTATIVLLACGIAARADMLYRWVDAQGVVHYSDIAPPAPANVEQRKITGNVIQTSDPDFATQRAMKKFPISLFTAPNCKEPCDQARGLLQRRGVPYQEVSVNSKETAAELKSVSGSDEVPVLKVGKDVQKGFEEGSFNASLDAAGYPSSAAHKPPAPKPAAIKRPADADKSSDQGAGLTGEPQ